MNKPAVTTQQIIQHARELGFALVGVCEAAKTEHEQHVRDWLAADKHGEMHYLANHLDVRLDPGNLLDGARSIICVADKHSELATQPPAGPAPHGRIARYAFGKDYHKTMKKRLHMLADVLAGQYPNEQFRSTVDTAPILEREVAAKAGLGWIGKHTLLIHPRFGSYFLLGTIVTTLKLQTSEEAEYPDPTVPPTDHCGTCTRCIDACPTQCISRDGPRSIDASRCISYLTIEHRSEIAPSLQAMMDNWIAGCDVCQEVCPHNRAGEQEKGEQEKELSASSRLRFSDLPLHPDHTPRPPAPGLSLTDILDWNEDDRRIVFQGSALKRIKLDMLKRNALIALGNVLVDQNDPILLKRINDIAVDESEPQLVRITAQQVLARLNLDNDCGDS